LQSPGWILFLSGALVFTIASASYELIKARNAELQTKLAMHAKPSIATIIDDNPHTKKEVEAVDHAIHEIVIPWASLWKSLEATNIEGVGMLSLEPDAKKHIVHMKLIALNHAAMWGYMQSLNQQNNLSNIRLLSSDVTEVNGQYAVSFSVEATWSV
jgi:hypothetical protein